MMESMAINYFRCELTNIQNSNLKDFVYYCFEHFAPNDFYTAPASSTGKHHPECSLGEGGLVRHIKLTCWWAERFIDCFALDLSDADCVRAAVLLHDLYKTKVFPELTHEQIIARHGAMLAYDILSDQLWSFVFGPQHIESEYLDKIVRAIAGHMGRWTTPVSAIPQLQPLDLVPLVVYLADYVASQRVNLDTILGNNHNE